MENILHTWGAESIAQVRRLIDDGHGPIPGIEALDGSPLYTGVDLGTANTVIVVLDNRGRPVGGACRAAQVVRDGLVVDFIGAVDLLREMKAEVEVRLGRKLETAWTAYPPGVPMAERRATGYVLEGAGLECLGLVDEPSAANQVLEVRDGAIVDVGGGTTGVAVVQNGEVVYTADEATGGAHFTLILAGGLNLSFEEAEKVKVDPREQERLFPRLRPVMEKVAVIVQRHIAGFPVAEIQLVGGSSLFPRMAEVVQEVTGIPTRVPLHPLYVTPLGIARAGMRGEED